MTSTRTPEPQPSHGWLPTRAAATKIAIGYALVGGLWILCSGWFLHRVTQDAGQARLLEQCKGWMFVIVTAGLLRLALGRYFGEIRRSAALLQDSERRWLFALEGAGHGVWDWNVQTHTVYYSARWKAMLGFEPHEIGNSLAEWENRVHPEDIAGAWAEIRRHLDGQTPTYRSEHRIRAKDGSYVWVLDQGKVMSRTPDGQPVRFLGTHTDITEQRTKDAALRQWAHAFEHCAHGIAMCVPESNHIMTCNPAFARMLGRPIGEIAGTPVLDLYVPEDRPRVSAHLADADCTGQASYESRMVRADGSAFPVQMDVASVRDPAGNLLYRVATAQDITSRKLADEAIRASEERHRTVVEHCGEAIFLGTPDGGILSANPAACRMFGYSEERLRQLGRLPLMDGTDPRWKPAVEQRASTGEFHGELGWLRSNGERFDGEVTSITFEGPDGELRASTIIRDITERRSAERALRESEARFRSTLDNMLEGCQIIGFDWRYRYVNAAAARQGRATVDALVGRTMMDVYPGIQKTDLFSLLKRCMEERLPQDLENEFFFPDGTKGWFQLVIQPVAEGIFVLSLDITERKRAEDELRQSQERYRDLVETVSDWVWEIDADGRYTYASPKVRDLLGYAPEEVLGLTPFDLMPEAEAHRLRAVFREIAAKRAPFGGIENVNRHKDGRLIVLETSGQPVFGPGGQFRGYRGMDRDISERKGLEAQLRQTQKLEAIGQLAGGVAHDFNNILAAVMMHVGILQQNPKFDADTRHALADIDAEAQRAANLTRQLLMFSRRSVLASSPLDLNTVVGNLLKMLNRLIGENVDLRFDRTSALPMVEADAGLMEQVLMNLVVNARDAMPRGGRIAITTSAIELTVLDARDNRDRRPGCFVCLTVSDTGCGMDEETLKQIFDPFFTTKEPGKGTGLGLSTVQGIVAQHKGWVEVKSEVGKGTTFQVFLPAVPRLPADSAQAPRTFPLRQGNETILLVEDDPRLRLAVARSLRKLGYLVHEAENGQQALRVWQEHGPSIDLLLSDMVMPEGISGLELAERLRALKPDLKAIISSGYSADIVASGLPTKAGVMYLPKPYATENLADAVRSCLDEKA